MNNGLSEYTNLISDNSIWIWRIRVSLVLVLASLVFGGLFVFFPVISAILEALLLLTYLFALFIYIPGYYRECSYYLKNDTFIVKKGFFISKYSQVRFSDIQYCVIAEGIIQKRFKVCTVYLMMEGSHVRVHEISLRHAYEIKSKVEGSVLRKR